jgi:hypothetical protein
MTATEPTFGTVEATVPEFPRVLSSSMREAFSLCPRKFQWEQIYGYIPKEESVHLKFGSAYAAGIEAYRRSYYGSANKHLSPSDKLSESLADGMYAAILDWGDYEPPDGVAKTFERLIGALVEYTLAYQPETDGCKPSMFQGEPRVEFSFTFEIPGIRHPTTGDPLLFTGRCDMLAEFNKGLFIFDDKTTGALGPSWANQWRLRSQFTAYTVGAQEAGHAVVGAIIRGIAILKTKYNLAEVITHRPPHIVEAWKKRVVHDAERMIEMWGSGYWPEYGQENGGCGQYGGCPYQMLCESVNPQGYLDVYFQNARWDPVVREIR